MSTKAQLVEEAKALGVKGAAQMNKEQLETALTPISNPEPLPAPETDDTKVTKAQREDTRTHRETPLVLIPHKGVLYTDGLSGPADSNLERAYEIAERLQTSDADQRDSGDQSLSEAAKARKTDAENRRADFVKKR